MSHNYRRHVEDIVEALKGAKQRGHACSLLVGAGCSVEGGIPTAGQFVELIRNRFPRAYDRATTKTYPLCMAELSIAERHALIAEQVDAAQINWAHIGIALLMQHGFVDRILTTNFDPLIIRACAMVGEFPAVYDFAASQQFKPDFVPDKAVFYLHGQRTGFRVMNTREEVDALSRSLPPVFQDAGLGRAWVVAGYSGDNDPVFEQLANIPQFDHQLFWVGYKDGEPSQHVKDRLLVPGKYAFFVGGHTADSFFVTLTQQLGIFPPSFVARPFTHLAGQLKLLASYTPPGGVTGMNVLDLARDWIAGAQRTYEPRVGSELSRSHEDIAGRIVETFMEGGYEQVVQLAEQHRDTLPREVSESVAWAYVMSANRLGDDALAAPDQRDELFSAAFSRYALALRWKPDFSEALNSWAITLYDMARVSSGEGAETLLREAEDKYMQAVAIKPNDPKLLNNWGNVLEQHSDVTTGSDAEELLIEAQEKYLQALSADPGFHDALNNWAVAALKRARVVSPEQAVQVLREAGEKLAEAEKTQPGIAAYNLACITARLNDPEKAHHWLRVSADTGTLPNAEHLRTDSDLASLRDTPWFEEFVRTRAQP